MAQRVIRLQVLIKPQWRNPSGVRRIQEIATSLGMEISGSGLVTISARMNPRSFQKVFEIPPEGVSKSQVKEKDKKNSQNVTSGDLRIPPPLQEYVETITIAPPHIYMSH